MLVLQVLIFIVFTHQSLTEEYHHLNLPKRRFFPLWNAPTEECKAKYNVTIELEKNGIVANEDHKWHGEHMNLLYIKYGLWPMFVNYDEKQCVNGGIPQLGNLTAHLAKMARDIEYVMADKDYEGMAVIDFESWSPNYERLWGNMTIYRNKSEELVRNEHPKWDAKEVFSEAKRQFESAAKDFMLETLKLGRQLRPKALWGYYGFPRCYNGDTNTSTCPDGAKKQNDKLMWMFNESTVILPSIYLNKQSKTDPFDYVKGNILEAMRVGNQTDDWPLPVFAYVRLLYKHSRAIFLNKTDMYATVIQSAELAASGVIIWGASADVTERFCRNLKSYIDSFFGPLVLRLSSIAEKCSKQHCSSNGRCQFKMSRLKQFEMSGFLDRNNEWTFVRCNCDRGWEGRDCSGMK